MATIYCTQCGTAVTDQASFCPNCGAALVKKSAPAAPVTPVEPTPAPAPVPTPDPVPTPVEPAPAPAPAPVEPAPAPAPTPKPAPAPTPTPAPTPYPYAAEPDVPVTGFKVLSFFVPIVGLILFFVKRETVPNSAKEYLKFGIIGFGVWFTLNMIIIMLAALA